MLLCTLGYFVYIRICYVKENIVTFSTHEDCCVFYQSKIKLEGLFCKFPMSIVLMNLHCMSAEYYSY